MSHLTTGTAIKAYLEAAQAASPALAIPAVHTRVPTGEKMPYVLIHDAIANPANPADAPLTAQSRHGVQTEVQIDVWQPALGTADAAGARTRVYDPLLPELVAGLLDGADLGGQGTPGRIWGCRLIDGPRELASPLANNVMHHVIRLQVTRSLPTHR